MDKLDIAWGSPRFLEPYWKGEFYLNSTADYDMSYDHTHGTEEITKLILSLHELYHQLNLKKEWHVVITNGATQALQAAIASLPGTEVFAPAPYFPRFPKITEFAGKNFIDDPTKADITILTTPNNPDCTIKDSLAKGVRIYDMCYNWSTYNNTKQPPLKHIQNPQIYSLSKLSGHASTRFGWILTDDAAYATVLRQYIELHTCGVSIDSQIKAGYILRSLINNHNHCMNEGREILMSRWEGVRRNDLPVENNRGMFLWSSDREFWEKRDIVGLSGSEFGVSDNYYRLNLGCSDEQWREFIRRCF